VAPASPLPGEGNFQSIVFPRFPGQPPFPGKEPPVIFLSRPGPFSFPRGSDMSSSAELLGHETTFFSGRFDVAYRFSPRPGPLPATLLTGLSFLHSSSPAVSYDRRLYPVFSCGGAVGAGPPAWPGHLLSQLAVPAATHLRGSPLHVPFCVVTGTLEEVVIAHVGHWVRITWRPPLVPSF